MKSLYNKFKKALTYKYRSVRVPDIEYLNLINKATIRIIDVKLEGKHIKYLLGDSAIEMDYGWYFRHEFKFTGRA
jgi:hypothetical protein